MGKDFFSEEGRIYDSVHGFIHLDEWEKELIDSVPFQRLHHIRQLGVGFLVYPGATHTRFEHSLGTMELATRIYHNLSKTVRPDIFDQVPRKGSVEYHYWRRVLRFASLCHDLGHFPFSHAAENLLGGEGGHEKWTLSIIDSEFLKPIFKKVQEKAGILELFPDRDFIEDISKIAVGEKTWLKWKGSPFEPWEKVIAAILTGDFFGADRIDYLLRDSKSTGVAYGLFDYHQLIEMVRILPSLGKEGELELGINESGLESCEALLLARHFMHKRVYQYKAVKAYNFHLKRFMKTIFDRESFSSVSSFLKWSDAEVITELRKAALSKNHPGYEDACRIIYRKNRFKAVPIGAHFSEDVLSLIQKKEKIPSHCIAWEMAPSSLFTPSSFPVSKRHLSLSQAHELSQLLSTKFSTQDHWIYVDPQYEIPLLTALESYAK